MKITSLNSSRRFGKLRQRRPLSISSVLPLKRANHPLANKIHKEAKIGGGSLKDFFRKVLENVKTPAEIKHFENQITAMLAEDVLQKYQYKNKWVLETDASGKFVHPQQHRSEMIGKIIKKTPENKRIEVLEKFREELDLMENEVQKQKKTIYLAGWEDENTHTHEEMAAYFRHDHTKLLEPLYFQINFYAMTVDAAIKKLRK